MSRKKKTTTSSSKGGAKQKQQAVRKFYVFTALAGALTVTGAFLAVISPKPLRPETAMAASDVPEAYPAITTTSAPVVPGRWKYVYVHHSRSLTAPAAVTDHFVLSDEGLQATALWTNQRQALSPTGNGSVDPACVSVCVVGDFDRSLPTPVQQHRLTRLVDTLQSTLRMPTRCLIMLDQPESVGSVGKHFPTGDFRSYLMR